MSSKYLILFLICLFFIDQLVIVETNVKQKKWKKNKIKRRLTKKLNNMTDHDISPENCGELGKVMQPRITRGQSVKDGEYPWVVGLYPTDSMYPIQFCGGALLNNQWVITVAHCLFWRSNLKLFVKIGSVFTDKGTPIDLTKQIHYPLWKDNKMFEYDIALLKLEHPVKFNDRVKPICFLKDRNYLPLNKSMITAGWGISEIDPKPEQLQKMTSEIIDSEKCKDLYKFKLVEGEIRMFCTLDTTNKSYTCEVLMKYLYQSIHSSR